MLILAFDTSGAACSAALWRDGKVIAQHSEAMERGQAEALMPMIEQVMAGTAYADLDRIAVAVGPGSFTGVRVGLAAARGLALALNKPIVGLTTTQVLAAMVPPEERRGRRILAAIDTKRGDLYVQAFDDHLAPLQEPAAVAVTVLAAWLGPGATVIVGDGSDMACGALGDSARRASTAATPDAATLAALAATCTPAPPLPLYVHPPAITPSGTSVKAPV